MDKAHKQTDKQLEKIERKLTKIYEDADFELSASWNDYMKKVEKKSVKLLKAIDEATDDESRAKAEKEYQRFLRNSTLRDKHYAQMVEETAVQLYNVNETAVAYINGQLPETYALNLNWQNQQIASQVKGYSYTLVDKATVKHLATTNKSFLPFKKLNESKDVKWNTKKINSEVLQGVLQGESVPKIAKRIQKVQEMNTNASIRTARTMITSAENKGRLDSLKRAEADGIILEKEWIATSDSRTRDWHNELDGTTKPIDEPFENAIGKIMFPGDPSADGANVYNCRCSMAGVVKGFKKAQVEKAMEEVIETAPKTMSEHYDVLQTDEQKIDFISKNLGVSREQAEEYEISVAQYGGFSFSKIRQASYLGGAQFNEEVYAGKLVTSFNKIAQNIEEFIEKSPKWNGEIYRGINLPHDTVKAFKNGDIIDMQGVSSWTSSYDIAETYSHKSNKTKQNQRVIFHSNGTKQGTSIKHLAYYDFEDEVLVSTKARWQIDKIEEIDGATHVFLKELEFE